MSSLTTINQPQNFTININILLSQEGKASSTCNVFKPYSEYHKNSEKSCDGLKSNCKLCRNENGKQYRSTHKGKRKEYYKNIMRITKNE